METNGEMKSTRTRHSTWTELIDRSQYNYLIVKNILTLRLFHSSSSLFIFFFLSVFSFIRSRLLTFVRLQSYDGVALYIFRGRSFRSMKIYLYRANAITDSPMILRLTNFSLMTFLGRLYDRAFDFFSLFFSRRTIRRPVHRIGSRIERSISSGYCSLDLRFVWALVTFLQISTFFWLRLQFPRRLLHKTREESL